MVKLIIKENSFSYCNRHLFDMLDLLVKKYNWKYVSKDDIINEDFKFKNFYNKIEHLLLITGSSQIKNYKVPKSCKISYVIDDLHTGGEIKKGRINTSKLVYKIFATYGYCFEKFFPMIPKEKVVWFPHSARYILDLNMNPVNKILVSGRFSESQYPNRFKIIEMSKKENFIHYEKPKLNGYRANNNNDIKNRIYGEKFYKLLSKYLICFTCDANESRPYIVAKHFEILASGSLLFACNPHTKKEFESLGFKDGEDYISCNNVNMKEKITWLKNPLNLEKINIIRKNGNRKVCNHTWKKRTELLNYILK